MNFDGPIRVHGTRTYPVVGRPITATVTHDSGDIDTWVQEIYNVHGRHIAEGRLVAGLGVQWRPGSGHGGQESTAVVQVCVGRRCLVVQLCHCREVPQALRNFLADCRVTFAGVGVDDDVRRLGFRGLRVGNPQEVRKLAVDAYGPSYSNASMGTLADRVLGFKGVTKDGRVSRSNWEAVVLSREQVTYACEDAYLSFRLALRILHGA